MHATDRCCCRRSEPDADFAFSDSEKCKQNLLHPMLLKHNICSNAVVEVTSTTRQAKRRFEIPVAEYQSRLPRRSKKSCLGKRICGEGYFLLSKECLGCDAVVRRYGSEYSWRAGPLKAQRRLVVTRPSSEPKADHFLHITHYSLNYKSVVSEELSVRSSAFKKLQPTATNHM